MVSRSSDNRATWSLPESLSPDIHDDEDLHVRIATEKAVS